MQYPNKIKKCEKNNVINHANRGLFLESLVNDANSYYLDNDIAVIYKKPTSIGITKASYNKRGRVITEAYFIAPSTLDYNGVYKGKYIEFDAKETMNKTAFPLANIHKHQIAHLKNVIRHGGIAFLIIMMNQKYYLLKGEDLISFLNTYERKSIPYSYILDYGYLIDEKISPAIDYIKALDKAYFKGE